MNSAYTVHAFKNIKNGSYSTIHTFKNYFTIVFSVFNFSNNKFNPNKPKMIFNNMLNFKAQLITYI